MPEAVPGRIALLVAMLVVLAAVISMVALRRALFRQRARSATLERELAARSADLSSKMESLARSEARFRWIAAFSSDLYWEQGPDMRLSFTSAFDSRSPLYAAWTGDIGKLRWELPYVDTPPEVWETHKARLAARQPFRDLELKRYDALGRLRWMSLSGEPVFTAEGEFAGYRGIAREVTERKEAETALRRLAARYEHLVENASDIIYETDPAGRFTYFNTNTVFRILGYSPSELLGRHYLDLVRADWRPRVEAFYRDQFYRGVRITYFEFPALGKDGGEVWFGQNVQQVWDAGSIVRHEAICRNITDRKHHELALEASRQELRELAAHVEDVREHERTRIAREIHDELGGLLTGIQANVTTLIARSEREDAPPEPRLVQASALVDTAMEAVRKVIADLRPSILDHLGVWAAIEWYASRLQETTGLECRVNVDAEVADVAVDTDTATSLFRIVQEAMTNVVKHAGARSVSVDAGLSGDSILVSVSDDGCGIDEARLAHRRAWGIVGMRERAGSFGGALSIEGRESEGTTVEVRVPLREHVHA